MGQEFETVIACPFIINISAISTFGLLFLRFSWNVWLM